MFGLRAFGFGKSRTMDQLDRSGAANGTGTHGMASGMVAGTKVATDMGWRPVEGIVAGDMVLTFDGGLQEVVSVERGHLWSSVNTCPRHLWPLRVAPGTIGNAQEAILLPEQPVMIESDFAEDMLGDPFALIPAAALEGFAGVTRVIPHAGVDVVILHFARDQVVFANMGALFLCPAARQALTLKPGAAETSPYQMLPKGKAAQLLAAIEADSRPVNLFAAPSETPVYAAR